MIKCTVVLIFSARKKLPLDQKKNKGAAIEKPLFVVQGCIEMANMLRRPPDKPQ